MNSKENGRRLWRWANKKHTALRLVAAGAGLVLLGFFLGGVVWRP